MRVEQIITERIIAKLDQGIIPWRKTWQSGVPCNGESGYTYRGINAILAFGYDNPKFYTFNQVKVKGEMVKKCAKGIPIVYWDIKEYTDDDGNTKKIPLMKYYTVFNECDTTIKPKQVINHNDPIAKCEQIVAEYIDKPVIKSGEPSYHPIDDHIEMPGIDQFKTNTAYYDVLYHELAHSTKAPTRLNRNLKDYAQEEVVAEIGSAILCATAGITNDIDESNNVAYIQHWSAKFKEDNGLIVKLASMGQRASDYIQGVRQ